VGEGSKAVEMGVGGEVGRGVALPAEAWGGEVYPHWEVQGGEKLRDANFTEKKKNRKRVVGLRLGGGYRQG